MNNPIKEEHPIRESAPNFRPRRTEEKALGRGSDLGVELSIIAGPL